MRRALTVLTSASIIASTVSMPGSARADGGRVAAGLVGGLAAGTLLGAAIASRPYYYAPAPVYVEPAPVYVAPRCYWTRGEPVWDDWRGVWYRPRMQICD